MLTINIGNREYAVLDDLPNNCPYCHKSITPVFLIHNKSEKHLEGIFRCPNLDCNQAFIGIYTKYFGNEYQLERTNIGTIKEIVFTDNIVNISPGFVKIFNESHFAENHELFEICGVGYRKALEFLIKDYLAKKNEDKEDEIKRKLLGKCIEEYIEDLRIKKVAKRAVWLGNDETHYVRKWEGKNLIDLKNLINLTLHWIEMDYLTEEIETDMPE